MSSSLVLMTGAAAFFGISIAAMVMRRRGACVEALYGAWFSGVASLALVIAAAIALHPAGTPEQEALWLCYRSSNCDLVRFAEAIQP